MPKEPAEFVECNPNASGHIPGALSIKINAPSSISSALEAQVTAEEQQVSAVQINEVLRSQLSCLQKELEILRAKSTADQQALRELDRLRSQVESFSKFKAAFAKSQRAVQRDVDKAKQDALNATQVRNTQAKDLTKMKKILDQVTLDKAIAERQIEVLQLKLEQATTRIANLQTEIAACKDNANKNNSQTNEFITKLVKQLQDQDDTVRQHQEAVKLHKKNEPKNTMEKILSDNGELTELQRSKEQFDLLKSRAICLVAQIQNCIIQNDIILGSLNMIESLAKKKILEDKVAELIQTTADLIAIQCKNEQLRKSFKNTKKNLNEIMGSQESEVLLRLEIVADRDGTIVKWHNAAKELIPDGVGTNSEVCPNLEDNSEILNSQVSRELNLSLYNRHQYPDKCDNADITIYDSQALKTNSESEYITRVRPSRK